MWPGQRTTQGARTLELENRILANSKKTLLRPILLYAIVGAALTMLFVAKVSRRALIHCDP